MGLAYEVVGFNATTGAVANTYANAVADAGDSLVVRTFEPNSRAWLEFIGLQAAAAGATRVEVKSPVLHDNVQGMELVSSETPASFLVPARTNEPMQPGDTLGVSVATSVAAATVIGGALGIYYQNAQGIAAVLKMWPDISSQITHIKPFSVTPGAVAANTWLDTALTTAGAQLDANRYYAVLGYLVSDPYIAVAIKSQQTGNLRCGGPGAISTLDLGDYFAYSSEKNGVPQIPVFFANNKGSTYLSLLSSVAVAAPKDVTLICAQLAPGYQP